MDKLLIILIHLTVWPTVAYALGLILWWTIISDEGKTIIEKWYYKKIKQIKKNLKIQ